MARGFGTTYGVGTTDKITTGFTKIISSLRSYSWWQVAKSSGGGSLARIMDTGSENILYDNFGIDDIEYDAPFSTTAGAWSVAFSGLGSYVWNHFVLTYDPSSTSNDPLCWQNGVSSTVTRQVAPSGTVSGGTGTFTIGNRPSDSARCWDGIISDFAIWDAILTQAEARQLYFGLKSPPQIRPNKLAYWNPLGPGMAPWLDRSAFGRNAGSHTGTKLQSDPPFIFSRDKPTATSALRGARFYSRYYYDMADQRINV